MAITRLFRERQLWVWVLPPLLFEFTRHEYLRLHFISAAIIAVWLVIAVSRRPALAATLLVVLLPFDTYLLAGLLRTGVPASVIRPLRFWQYVIIGGLAIAAIREYRRRRPGLDRLDKAALAYLAVGTAYLILPAVFVGSGPGAHLSFYTRELGWRSDVSYAGVFLIVRHLRLGRNEVERILRGLLIAGTIIALLGVFEFVDKNSWNHIAVKVFRVTKYDEVILHYIPSGFFNPASVLTFGTFGGHRFVRVGSVLDYENLSFYMAISLGVAAEFVSRAKAKAWLLAAMPVMALALLFTQTRSGIIAGVVAISFALRAQIGRSITHRIRLSLLMGVLIVVALPFVVLGGVGHRIAGGQDNSTHRNDFSYGVKTMEHHPLGRGLATSAGAGQQAVNNGAGTNAIILITESQWLQIGTQVGFLGLAIYLTMYLQMIRGLRPRRPTRGGSESALAPMGVRNVLIGLAVGGTFLQPFINLSISFTTFALIGLGMGLVDQIDISADSGDPPRRPVRAPRPLATIAMPLPG